MASSWLSIRRGEAPLLVSLPHTGTEIPVEIEASLVSAALARKDTDWWIEQLYDFASELDATVVRTSISRTVIDVNRDPSGASLYPGQATTGLCPTTTFDGDARRHAYFDPYHTALAAELQRLRRKHPRAVIYDCHSIRSVIPRLFEGRLPVMNLGTNSGSSADAALAGRIIDIMVASGQEYVVNGRFKGGWITRHYGRPDDGISALQMELACRGYMEEPAEITPSNWPTPYDPRRSAELRRILGEILVTARDWAAG